MFAVLLHDPNDIRNSGYYLNGYNILPIAGWVKGTFEACEGNIDSPRYYIDAGFKGLQLVDNIDGSLVYQRI